MEDKQYCIKTELLAKLAKAIAHPARISIMQFLAKSNQCFFGDISDELPISKATVSQHLKELKDAGLIQGKIITPKVKYCINKKNWDYTRQLFTDFFDMEICEKDNCQCKE